MSSIPEIERCDIAIVGGGASGALVAANLLRLARRPLRLVLIERKLPAGRGVAFGTENRHHVLNVPAGRMGAWADEPGHFLEWVRAHPDNGDVPAKVEATDFLPRWLYGTYMADVLATARANSATGVELEMINGDAIDIEERPEGGGVLRLADGRLLAARQVVLAVGNLPGEYPIHRALPVYRSSRYVHVPWRGDALEGIAADDEVLLVGQGLTAIDIIVQLDRAGHRGTIHVLSRNGLRPHVHQPYTPRVSSITSEQLPMTLRQIVRQVRSDIRAGAKSGIDWRAVIDGLRPLSQAIWQQFSPDDRARFMKYIRPFWEAHRHRLAPSVAAVVDRMTEEGRLKAYAGRLQVLEADASGVQALFRRRATIQHVSLRVAKVINCTGPRTDYSKYQHPLFIHLLARGLIDHDPLALGINALPNGQVLRYRGGPVDWLYTLGSPMKGVLWESTAVPEIRVQAKALAETLLKS